MLRNVKNLQKYQVVATDGPIGHVDQFFLTISNGRFVISWSILATGCGGGEY
jgi:hypothetical protein